MLLLPSSPPCVSVVWGCRVYGCTVKSYVVSVTGMLCPLLRGYGTPPSCVCALVAGLLVGWLLVFGLLGWLLGWLVGCLTAELG